MTKAIVQFTTGRLMAGPNAAAQDHLTPEARIGERIRPAEDGCWIYNDAADDYGQLSAYGKSQAAHRYVYEILVGPIPRGHHLHHTCETPGCVNPSHLMPLTRAQHRAHRSA